MVKKKKAVEESVEVKENSISKIKINYWMIASIVLAIAVLVMGIVMTSGISAKTAEKKFLEFTQSQGADVEVLGVKKVGSLYEITFDFMGQEGKFYVTRDGNYLIDQAGMIPLKEAQITNQAVKDVPKELVKSDKPTAELFIMTHCPYGTQAEKGFIPFMESAIDGKIDATIRFVHYFMHGDVEEQETYRQLCIREEQSSKYLTYLREFLEEGDSTSAGSVAKIDEAKVSQCISNGNAEKYYSEDSELSQKYGVQGSPTLILNGVEVSSGRSSSAYLNVVCSAFNNAPSECSTLQLSSENPSPMWGWDSSSASATTAQC